MSDDALPLATLMSGYCYCYRSLSVLSCSDDGYNSSTGSARQHTLSVI